MWLKKYLAPLDERPIWAFVTDQIVFKYTQKTPAVNDRNKINWALQTWDITETKERKIPNYIKEMLKIGRKYNIGYDTIVAGKDQRRQMPLWHHVGVLDNHSWNKKLASCLRLTHKIRTVGDLEDYIEKDSRHWHCKRLARIIMNKIPPRLHPSKLEIEDNLDFTPRRLRMEKEGNNEIQDTLDPNTIDNRSPEKAIHIFGSYKRYKNRKEKKESRLLKTPIKRKVDKSHSKINVYYTILEPETKNNRTWYTGAIRTTIDETDETKTYRINSNLSKETADILIVIEALKIKGDIHIKTNRIETMKDIKLNIKRWEKEDFLQKEDREAWRAIAYQLRLHEGETKISKIETEEEIDIIKKITKTLENGGPAESIWLNKEEIPEPFKLEGSELAELTQKKAYKMILRQRKRQPGNDATKRRIEKTKEELLRKTGTCITRNDIWINNGKRIIPPKVNDFLWKLCHDKHKIGPWFLKIKGWENKAHCKCGKLETMNYIIMECSLNQGPTIWNYMKNKWKQTFSKTQWLQLTIELIRGLGSIQLGKSPRWMNKAYIERVTEATWLIWTIRNNQIFNKREMTIELATKMIERTLQVKIETEWTYITNIKDTGHKDKKTLIKKWGKIMTKENK